MPIYGHSIGLSASSIGMVMGVYAVAMVAIRLLSPWLVKRLGEETVLRSAMLAAAAVYCAFPFATHIAHLGALAVILGLSLGCCVPLAQMIIHGRAPEGRGGEAMGVRHTLNKMIDLGAPLAYGWLGAAVGTVPIFWACACVLFGGNTLVASKKVDIPFGESTDQGSSEEVVPNARQDGIVPVSQEMRVRPSVASPQTLPS